MSDQKNLDPDNQMDILKTHSYDGIQEYDNPLPNWWLMTFFATIIFGSIYWIHYEFGGGLNFKQELSNEMESLKSSVAKQKSVANENKSKEVRPESDPDLLAAFTNETQEQGKAIFASRCVSCHGAEGQGNIGPNLTDHYWLNGDGTPKEILRVITKGVPEKGMLAWESILSSDEILQATSFVYSLRNTKPANAKAPQGQEYK